ncbi:unnamed protein product [Kuraishia capsulata CBS 1993]|uniref:RRM domain-containing protein n=1 Tax=Kuraishia capsulata CBS 1993 TaxID=1382522 RepID=W6MK20_9ASCO|nr:uncharacterized protein KUCA_T00002629001 [Kuraishia capsulata CBS 1993]CDK26656.1 unnamed protein product [Kuraishia capsulata CBS 1993]
MPIPLIGGLPFDLTEGDVLIIFSQYGVPVFVKLMRDSETGASKGFAFLKYEDVRSTVLAVDNLNGAKVLGRVLRVDHTRFDPNKHDNEREDVSRMWDEAIAKDMAENDFASAKERKEEEEERLQLENPEDDVFADPMKNFEKKSSEHKDDDPGHSHRPHRSHKSHKSHSSHRTHSHSRGEDQ